MKEKYEILSNVYCGFDCPPGWLTLVDKLCADLTAAGYTGKVAQVKQKFGGLRFYADDTEPHHDELIATAECDSTSICEECGALGKLRGGGWIRTLCDEHDAIRHTLRPRRSGH